jgi:hypothetical protein
MNKKLLLAAPLALAAGAVLATPATARDWNYGGNNLRAEIAQLDRQIDSARGISYREARDLHRQVDKIAARYGDDARDGLSRREAERLESKIASVRADIARQAHDWNGRDGHDRHDRR